MTNAPPTSESLFNLFVFFSEADRLITELGISVHALRTGRTHQQKVRHLQLSVADDLPTCQRFPVPARYALISREGKMRIGLLPYRAFRMLMKDRGHLAVFAEAFQAVEAPRTPFVVITPIVDGAPRVDEVARF
ncbi:MAG TPA: hypothetical protein VH092_01810 [Urbifossiella sp.]|jgi:hypothetical protein|nr:hypothetical protein [Urbifossiella sp.]